MVSLPTIGVLSERAKELGVMLHRDIDPSDYRLSMAKLPLEHGV
jgi:hypothetical protein